MVEKGEKTNNNAGVKTPKPGGKRSSAIEWNEERMQTGFANVVNVQSTQEQVELFFGTNRTWNVNTDEPLKVDLSNRLILTPYAAKRLCNMLTNVMRVYEARHGALTLNG